MRGSSLPTFVLNVYADWVVGFGFLEYACPMSSSVPIVRFIPSCSAHPLVLCGGKYWWAAIVMAEAIVAIENVIPRSVFLALICLLCGLCF